MWTVCELRENSCGWFRFLAVYAQGPLVPNIIDNEQLLSPLPLTHQK
jgi:hypothetical protein